jgi:hypothetical protein
VSVLPGNTFLDTTDNPHLWIVVDGPDAEGKVIIVNVTSLKGRDDRTTPCRSGDHAFIHTDSVIAYKYATHTEVKAIEAGLKDGTFLSRDNCSKEFLKKVADGVLRSDSTPLGVANAYVDILRSRKKP